MQPVIVGDVVVQPLYDGTAVLTTDMFFGSDWTEHRHLLADDGTLVVPVGGFLVRLGEHLVLLDAGVGDVHDTMFDGGRMLESLHAVGVREADIDTIVVSHLHSDHMGWLERDGAITFPNATIHVGAADWRFFVDEQANGKRRAERLRVVQEHVSLIHHDGTAILPGLVTRATPGHTPGHTSTVITSGAERLIVLGDALHCPAQLTETEWEFLYDEDRALAARTRQALVREGEQTGTMLLPCHFPGMTFARLLPMQGVRRWSIG